MISGRLTLRGKIWALSWNEGGKWHMKSTHMKADGPNPPPRALRMLADLQERLLCQKTGDQYTPKLLVSEAFLEWSGEDRKISSEGTWKFRQSFVPRFFGEALFAKMVGHVTEADILGIIARLNESDMGYKTKRTIFGSCGSFWDFCKKKNYTQTQFFHKMNRKKLKGDMEPRLERRALSDDEAERLFKALSENRLKWPLTCAMIGIHTGARISEAIQVRPETLSFGNTKLDGKDVPCVRIKDIKRGGVVMEKVMSDELEQYLKGLSEGGFPPSNVNKHKLAYHFQNAAIKAGIPTATFHWLRHTLASRLLKHGIPERIASAIIGHTEAVHKEYAHIEKGQMKETLTLVSVGEMSGSTPKNGSLMLPQVSGCNHNEADSLCKDHLTST